MERKTFLEKELSLAAEAAIEDCRQVRARIRRNHPRTGQDPNGRPSRLERLVAHLEGHLYEHDLSVGSASEAVGIGDRSIGGELREYAGFTADEYIDKLRIKTAVHLVTQTRISFGTIASLVGFRAYRTFSRTYKVWVGEPPGETRKGNAARAKAGSDLPFDFGDPRVLRQIGRGELSPEKTRSLRDTLAELYPDVFADTTGPPTPPSAPVVVRPMVADAAAFERFQTETVLWPQLDGLPFAEQRKRVRACPSWTPAFFETLHRKAREAGRHDRRRGVEVAQLALDALDGNEERLGERVHELRAEGWSWLGNARRLALDFSGAERPFVQAEEVLDDWGLKNTRVGGVFYALKGTLRMFQRRHGEALDLYDSALPLLEKTGDVRGQIKTLLHRAAALSYAERYREVEPTLERATPLVTVVDDETLTFWVDYTIATALARSGRFKQAEKQFASTAKRASTIENLLWRIQAQWLDAFIDHGLGRLGTAEMKYLAVRHGLEMLADPLNLALLLLDLAVLYVETGKAARIPDLAATIVPVFQSVYLYDETIASLQMLGVADKVTKGRLVEVRAALWRDPLMALREVKEPGRALTLNSEINQTRR